MKGVNEGAVAGFVKSGKLAKTTPNLDSKNFRADLAILPFVDFDSQQRQLRILNAFREPWFDIGTPQFFNFLSRLGESRRSGVLRYILSCENVLAMQSY